ncbi:MAG: hypothetical protein HZA54_19030 [Planctomycetes bacterium]|nr:hypothetical protein [Planctomycetota bacterium]
MRTTHPRFLLVPAVALLLAALTAGTAPAQDAPKEPAKQPAAEKAAATEPGDGWSADTMLSGRFLDIRGDNARFREDFQTSSDFKGGLDQSKFSFKNKDGALLRGTARMLYANDYGIDLRIQQEDKGWVRIKADTHPHYFDDVTYGYRFMPNRPGANGVEIPSVLRVDQVKGDLTEHIGDVEAEVGLTLSGLPKFILGYKHGTRTGNQSLGFMSTMNFGSSSEWNRYPLWQDIDYTSDRIYGAIIQDLGSGWELAFRPQYEIFAGEREYTHFFFDSGAGAAFDFLGNERRIENHYDNRLFNGSLRVTGELVKDTLHLDAGYTYLTRHNQNNVDATGIAGELNRYAEKTLTYVDNTHNSRDGMHRFDVTLTCTAAESLSAWVGLQYRNGSARNHANRNEDGTNEVDRNGADVADENWNFRTTNDEEGFAESLGVEFRGLEKTKIVVKAEMEQLDVDYDWDANLTYLDPLLGGQAQTDGDWAWKDTGSFDRYQVSLLFNTKAIDALTISGRYRYSIRMTDHVESLDAANDKPGDPDYQPHGVPLVTNPNYTSATWLSYLYPGTIGDSDLTLNNAWLKAEWQANDWVTVTPRLEFEHDSYENLSEVVPEIGTSYRWTYGLELLTTPVENLTWRGDYHFIDGHIWTRSSSFTNTIGPTETGFSSPGEGAAYRGALTKPVDSDANVYESEVTYALDPITLRLGYQYRRENWLFKTYRHYGTFGAEYQVTDKCSVEGTFGYVDYQEEQNQGINDYDGPLGMLSLKAKF